jgi:predicted dienelactone hydrolase
MGPIGVAGFSSGGYAAAALVGARLSAPILEALFTEQIPVPEVREFPGLADALRGAATEADLAAAQAAGSADHCDPRIAAAFLVGPASGQLVEPESLRRVARPVRVWWGDADTVTPPDVNALVYRDAIPDATGRSAGPDVGHYDFSGGGAGNAAVRDLVAADAVSFFRMWLVLAA